MWTDKIHRLQNYNYHQNGYYFVTIVSRRRKPLFLGREKVVGHVLQETVRAITGVAIDTFVVMPNHVHVIIRLQDCQMHVGEIVRRFKAKTSYLLCRGQTAWQSNYYEHIIRDDRSLHAIREYIFHNPEKELFGSDLLMKGKRRDKVGA